MDAQAKQQVVERIKQASNILVTVSQDPNVDQLASCIGTTLLLNKVNKHATAVFSGKVPSTLEFLQPEKTIETNTDSLRDFIISLDKAKADKLRYKVEDQFVRIFITPYRTSLSEKDLKFEQGDYNVDVVLALGITEQAQLDAAITAHGKILHDATVISINAGAGKAPGIGQINWQEAGASSLSEMIVSVSESFGSNLLDGQMATAFLTGIIAETSRFSNEKTSPKVMTMSAQLMAAGANQQLIVSKLEPEEIEHSVTKSKPKKTDEKPQPVAEGTLTVKHEQAPMPVADAAKEEKKDEPKPDEDESEIVIDQDGNIKLGDNEEPKKPEPILPPESDEEEPEPEPERQATMPGSHSLMTPKPILENPFRADPAVWEGSASSEDPLMAADEPKEGMIEHGPNVQPESSSHQERARSAVEKAFESASDNPAADALKEVVSSPPPAEAEEEAIEEEATETDEPGPAPMPFPPPPTPPPITTPQGLVIPPPYSPPSDD